jgi:nitrate/TMAO reductase-like tetraheme cytochrome c subunit
VRVLFSITWATIAITVVVIGVLLASGYFAFERYTAQSSFCGGSCHTMTEQYEAWQTSKHHAANNPDGIQAECVDCHFLPGEKYGFHAKMEGLRHLAAYLYDPDAPLPIRPDIKDGACLSSGCHSRAELADQELPFGENARFKHGPHFTDTALEGQQINCDTCHFKVTEERHFEVPTEICALCHLKVERPALETVQTEDVVYGESTIRRISFTQRQSLDFNSGLHKCSTCHIIPTVSLQQQLSAEDSNVKAITHQTIQEAGVACESCHFEVIAGHGEVETGSVVSNGCLRCHNRSEELLSRVDDGRYMHDTHVNARTADCFDCHTVIEHQNRTDHLDFVREDCTLCHQNQHEYQKILLAGLPVAEGISAQPHLMFNVNTNCMACHLKVEVSQGHAVRTGAPETCVACHTPEHEAMLADWKDQLTDEVAMATEVEQEALDALEAAKTSGVDEATRQQADEMIRAGSQFLEIVRSGNGVHNKKYAITILDEAFTRFEDAIDLLDSGG